MLTIRLIGIKEDRSYESWKESTQQVIHELGLPSVLEEVNDIDAIINSRISAIPALIIQDTVLLEQNGHTLDVAEIRGVILTYLNRQAQA